MSLLLFIHASIAWMMVKGTGTEYDSRWMVRMIMVAAMISAIYSYFVWRDAPDKRESPDYIV